MRLRRIAALYDIHGNLPALRAVLDEARAEDCDSFVFGGDVATGYMPAETVSLLMQLRPQSRYVMGNADRELIGVWEQAPAGYVGELGTWAARQLNRRQRDFLSSFEPVVEHNVMGLGQVLFCHGTPRSDEEIVTAGTPDAVIAEILEAVTAEIVVGGHTHLQMDRTVGGTRFINAGSVGEPYGGTGACWLLLGPGVNLRRTSYDLEAAAAAVRLTGGPGANAFAAENVLSTPSADEAIEVFERMAGRRGKRAWC